MKSAESNAQEALVQKYLDAAHPHYIDDFETGETLRLWGFGVLQGLPLPGEDIDWTAPVYEQVCNPDGTFKVPADSKSLEAA